MTTALCQFFEETQIQGSAETMPAKRTEIVDDNAGCWPSYPVYFCGERGPLSKGSSRRWDSSPCYRKDQGEQQQDFSPCRPSRSTDANGENAKLVAQRLNITRLPRIPRRFSSDEAQVGTMNGQPLPLVARDLDDSISIYTCKSCSCKTV